MKTDAVLIDDSEKKPEHRLDKYLDFFNPETSRKELKKRDLDYLEKMRKAFALRTRLFSPEHVRKSLETEYSLSYSQACQIYADMEYVFGKQEETDKSALKRILTEHYYTAIAIAVKHTDKDPIKASEAIIKATERISTLHGLNDGSGDIPVEQLMPPRTVTYVIQNAVITGDVAKEVKHG